MVYAIYDIPEIGRVKITAFAERQKKYDIFIEDSHPSNSFYFKINLEKIECWLKGIALFMWPVHIQESVKQWMEDHQQLIESDLKENYADH